MALKILKSVINIGISKPIRLLHMTDTHITRDDPTGWNRTATFDCDYPGCAEEYCFESIKYAKENRLPILHTGDLIDFFSKGNFAFIDEHFSDLDYIYAAGNHDFCHFLGKAKEDYDYKWEKIKEIAPHIKDNLYFDSHLIGGVNVVTLDDSYYLITKGQTELLRAEAAKGYPIILAMHVPIYSPLLADRLLHEQGHPCAYLAGAPEQLLRRYPDDRRLQQTPDEDTLAAIEYIKSEPMIKAVVAGHVHFNHEENLTDTLTQYITHGSFAGFAREIIIT